MDKVQKHKTTEELNHEISAATDVDDYLERNRNDLLTGTLSEHLRGLLDRKGLSRADVARGSQLDRTYLYQIFSGKKNPSRDKLIAIAFGLTLTAEETQQMLKISGCKELYARNERDALILFALHHGDTLLQANESLYEHHCAVLGN